MNTRTAIESAVIWARGQVARFVKDTRAVSTVEYALIVIAVIAIVGAAAALLGGAFGNLFDQLADEVNAGVQEAQNAGDDIS
ncbi:MAG: hypothetical protein OXG82_08300 [Gammaproteobacteria bacterium]|nr:hypothetical protein [Gammaproteobacteria bacterium]